MFIHHNLNLKNLIEARGITPAFLSSIRLNIPPFVLSSSYPTFSSNNNIIP
jgi:hypothetical protein